MGKSQIQGIIRSVRGDKKAFTLEDNSDKWYSSFEPLNISKGDKVTFELNIQTRGEFVYNNANNLKVIDKRSSDQQNDRLNIDAGNCLRAAIDYSVANKTELHSTLQLVLKEFDFAKSHISKGTPQIVEPSEVGDTDVGIKSNGTM